MRRPILPLAVLFVGGDLLALRSAGLACASDVPAALAAGGLCLLLAELLRRRIAQILPAVGLAAACIGFAAGRVAARPPAPCHPPEGPCLLSVVLQENLSPREFSLQARVRIEGAAPPAPSCLVGEGLLLRLPLDLRDPLPGAGDRLTLWARMGEPRGYGNPGAFDLQGWMLGRGVRWSGRCKSRLLIERGPAPDRMSWSRIRGAARRRLREGIASALPSDARARGLVVALVLGDRSAVHEDLAVVLAEAGAGHVLAVSGLHVGLMALALILVARRFAGPASSALLGAGGAWLYAQVAGGRPPALRAALVVAAVAAGRSLYRASPLDNLLGAALLALCAADPTAPLDLSFRMTFIAAFGIVWFTEPLAGRFARLGAPDWLARGLAASLAAQAALLPETTRAFGIIAPFATLVNLVAVPLVALLVPLGAIVALGGAWAAPVGWGAGIAAGFLEGLCEAAASFSWSVPPPSGATCLLYLALLLAAGLRMGMLRRCAVRRTWVIALAASCLLMVIHPFPAATPPGTTMRITALDVGQGDSILVEAGGAQVLVDTGGVRGDEFDFGRRVLAPALRARGLRRLSALALTHPDRDHVGGAVHLLERFEIGALWLPAGGGGGWEEILAAARRRGVPVRRLAAGDRLELGVLHFAVLGPSSELVADENDRSLVLGIGRDPGCDRILLPGDLEAAGERNLLERGLGSYDLLKVPHHGSRTSSTPAFLRAVRPKVMLLSVGGRNPWGHPHPEVVERLERGGGLLARTDREGAWEVAWDEEGRLRVRPLTSW